MQSDYEHIIFISLDTLRADCVGASPVRLWPDKYGLSSPPQTPLLDELAQRGAFFPNCISAAPYTSASHATYFTGQWPLRHGLFEFFNRRLESPTVFTRARAQGYRTVFKVDFPIILGKHLGFDQDVDQYIVEDDDRFLAAIEASGRSVSLAHFGGIHVPYGFHSLKIAGPDYIAKVEELESEIDEKFELPRDQLVETYRDEAELDLLYRYKRVIQYHYWRGDYSRIFELYLEGITYFMKRRFEPFLERLLDGLRGRRHLLVIFGDHGEEYDQESLGHFNTVAEGVLRVPVIFFGSDVAAGTYLDRIRTVDVTPTVLELLGGQSGPTWELDGVSLAPTLRNKLAYPARPAFSQVYAADTAEFVAHQKRLLATGEKPPLHHVRYKEAVYEGTERLVRQTYQYTLEGEAWELKRCPTRVTLETMGQDYRFRPLDDSRRVTELLSKLDAYNFLERGAGQQAHVTDEIRGQLRSMGYRT